MDTINNPQLMNDEQARRLGLYRPEKPKHYEIPQRYGMTLNEYQDLAWEFIDDNSKSLTVTAPGISEEAGELCGKYVKGVRAGRLNADYTPAYDMSQQEYDEFRRDVLREAGDVLWRLAAHCKLCGFTLNFVAETNLAKLRDRQERGVINGEGDNR